jgi:hypothetical protein
MKDCDTTNHFTYVKLKLTEDVRVEHEPNEEFLGTRQATHEKAATRPIIPSLAILVNRSRQSLQFAD